MHYQEYLHLLFDYGETAYASFSQTASSSDYQVIGVRIPLLRKIIKANYRDKALKLIDFELGKYLEVDFSYFAIGLLRCKTVDEQLAFVQHNMKFAKSWAITDMIASYFKKITFEQYWPYFLSNCTNEYMYVRRFAYVLGLKFYRDQRILDTFQFIQPNEDYMVYMGQAWLLATVAICYPGDVYQFLQGSVADNLKRKTISKIKESFRINDKVKKLFVDLRK